MSQVLQLIGDGDFDSGEKYLFSAFFYASTTATVILIGISLQIFDTPIVPTLLYHDVSTKFCFSWIGAAIQPENSKFFVIIYIKL